MLTKHDVTIEDVASRLPLASGQITSDSKGLSTGQIESWIRSGSGVLNALLRSKGIDPDELQPDEREVVRQGIIAFAESKALASREYDDAQVDRAHSEWQSVRDTIREFPTDMTSDEAGARIKGSGSDKSHRWSSDDFGGW